MKTYKVFEKNGVKIAVKQGWSWPAFFFGWIWAFVKKLILQGILGMVILGVGVIVHPLYPLILLTLGIIFGLKGNKWVESKLMKDGYSTIGTTKTENQKQAIANIK